jgi:hypothetical protein
MGRLRYTFEYTAEIGDTLVDGAADVNAVAQDPVEADLQ